MRAEFQTVRGTWCTWDELFESAARMATEIGSDRVIGLSHSQDSDYEGVITVWYWDQPLPGRPAGNRAVFRYFRSSWTSWRELFDDAGRFAGEVGPDRLIGISHSESKDDGVVTVWYWE